jgi:hypothetical protein
MGKACSTNGSEGGLNVGYWWESQEDPELVPLRKMRNGTSWINEGYCAVRKSLRNMCRRRNQNAISRFHEFYIYDKTSKIETQPPLQGC